MAVEFTPEQRQAIELHDRNILVSAAAGSGKTAVLSERIVQMVCREQDPVDIDRLLVVTFTNAAAAEMRERINQAILNRLNEDGENEHLQRQAALMHNAQITTIDSFCLFVLRNNFQDIGLDPAFRVADEGELELIRQDVLAQLLEERFAEGREAFYRCVEHFCPGGRESVLEEHIFSLYRYALSFPFPEEWLKARKRDYRVDTVEEMERSDWGRCLSAHLQKTVLSYAQELRRAREICEQPDGPYMFGEMLEAEEEQILQLSRQTSWETFSAKLSGISFGRLSTKKDEMVSPRKREQVKKLRDGVKDGVKKLEADFFRFPMEAVLRQSAECAEAVEELVELCLEFKRRLDEKKRDKKLLDFSDMEHFALEILIEKDGDGNVVPTRTAQEYREYFKEVLIDEYQDSNLVQEYLLKAVSGEAIGDYNRFMVGDVKQSIYKFRLARPELFLEKYHTYEPEGESTCRIDLHKNFRSRREVIDTVNTVFAKIMTKELGGIVYDDRAALYPGAVYPEQEGCGSELILFEKPEKGEELTARQAEALGIADRIKELRRSFQVTDKESGTLRPVMYRDIVILLRTTSGWDEEFRDVLAREGIPAHVTGKTGYFASKEIRDVLQFLRVLDNPRQDIPLFGVLRSVFGGFSDEEAAALRSSGEDRSVSLYDCICESADEKCRHFLEQLAKYRKYTAYMSILELLRTIFDEYDYLPYVAALPAGGKRLANVEMLLTKAAAFEKNSYYGLYHFIRYVEQLEKYNVDFGEAGTLDENADVVRIMSIHKSKGLEFPVAIVAGLSKRFNMQDAAQSMIVDMDLGIGVDYVNIEERTRNRTLREKVLAAKMKADNLAEELRVLYVAMTRAKEKLIMTGTVNQLDKALAAAGEGDMTYTRLCGATGFLDYLLPTFPNVTGKTVDELELAAIREELSGEGRRFALENSLLCDGEALAALSERFSYVYPHKDLEKLYTKTTVSELKMAALQGAGEEPAKELFAQKEVSPYIPDFMRGKEEVTGTVRGSAMHRVMELLDFTREYPDGDALGEVLTAFRAQGRLTEEYARAVRPEKILHFLHSPLAKRMQDAARQGLLYREQPFVYGIGASRLSAGENHFPEEETVLIQGIVDAFFEEDGGLILLDYKTDVIHTPAELADRYKVQLDYYEEALKNLTGKPVREKILYSFYLGETILVP